MMIRLFVPGVLNHHMTEEVLIVSSVPALMVSVQSTPFEEGLSFRVR